MNKDDLKENFFVDKSDLGKSRAQTCLENLLELNPDVKGCYYQISPQEFLQSSLLQLQTFDLVICANMQDVISNFYFHFIYIEI